jgi:hypothetical protein
MQGKTIATIASTFALVTAAVALGIGHLVQACAYDFSHSPSATCGMGICSGAPMVCSGWTPALWLAPLIGVVAGVGVAFIARSTVRQGTRNQAAAAPELWA